MGYGERPRQLLAGCHFGAGCLALSRSLNLTALLSKLI